MEVSAYYYKAYGLTIGSDRPLPPLPASEPAPVDLIVKRSKLPTAPPLVETKAYRAGLQAKFAQQGVDTLWLDWSPVIAFAARNGTELLVETAETDESVVALFTLSEALGLILFQRGFFLLHGSAIQLDNKGVVFVGEPGAGKSTTVAACAQRGFIVISDDLVCIRLDETDKPMLIPAFSQIKIWEKAVDGLQLSKDDLTPVREGINKFSWHQSITFDDTPVPLTQIYVLTPADSAAVPIQPLAKNQIPVELLGHFPLPDALLQGQPLKNYFDRSVRIAQTTPVSRLSRPADFTRLYEFVDYLKTTL